MCIRDSGCKAAESLSEVSFFVSACVSVVRVRPGATQLTRICLLYTSDAADERSSVDLGGRRIIKKNNNDNMNEILKQ